MRTLAAVLTVGVCVTLVSGIVPFTLIRNPHIFVRPDGVDSHDCGTHALPCRTVHHAVALAAPHTRILISNGTYDCGLHVTVPVAIVGVDSGVFLRCGGTKRGVWFDGVPAQIEGIHIEEGYGEGAGGVLVTQYTEHPHISNFISHCSFRACVGTPSHVVKGVAGAVLISYTKPRSPRAYFIENSRFESNYGRGDVSPSGALAIHMPPTTETPNDKCKVFTIDRSDVNDPRVAVYAGIYRAVEGVTISGTTVYNSLGRKPVAADEDLEVRWVALCPQNNLYGFYTTTGGAPTRPLDGCDSDISGMVHMDGVPLFENEWWIAKHSISRAFLHLRCQDDAIAPKKCDHFYPYNIPSPYQSPRQALFSIIPNLTVANRPTFATVDAEDPQWFWYCEAMKEWMISDVDPHTAVAGSDECVRGVASTPTSVLHPVLVDSWKYWNNVSRTWAPVPSRRVGGMYLHCVSPEELQCGTVQLLNANHDATVFHGDLSPATNKQFPRAVYTSYNTQPPQYMSYCTKFTEWMLTTDDARQDPTAADVCERSHASHHTTAPTPEEAGTWFVFGQNTGNWQLSAVDVTCVAACQSVTLSSAIDQPCGACGDYVAAGFHAGHRYYKQLNGRSTHVIFRGPDHPWVVAAAGAMREGASRDDVLAAAVVVGDTTEELMQSRRLAAGSSSAGSLVYNQLLLECAGVQNCSSFNVQHPLHTTFNGVYERRIVIQTRRPTYENRAQSAVIYFDDDLSRWILKHRDVPEMRLASRRTRTVTPGSTTVWSLVGKSAKSGSGEWVYAEAKLHATVQCEATEAARYTASKSAHGRMDDLISSSVFSANVALSNAMDNAPAAGAVMIRYETLPMGASTRGTIVGTSFVNNEALMPFKGGRLDSSGAVSVRNPSRTMSYITLKDTSASHNVADWGGAFSFTGATVALDRVVVSHNQALRSGGAIAGRSSHINASYVTCSHNTARTHGGCADLDRSTRLYIGKSELVNNSAGISGGTIASQGYVYVHGSKIDKMGLMAFTGAVLHLVDSALLCAVGRTMTYIGGFGCQADADPVPASGHLGSPAVDADEAWWINVANTTSQVAQVMLTITMAVFVLQYLITSRTPGASAHRSSQAARWHAEMARKREGNNRD